MLLIDKYIMNDAMNYEVAEEVACIIRFIRLLFIQKAILWWPLFLSAFVWVFCLLDYSFFSNLDKDSLHGLEMTFAIIPCINVLLIRWVSRLLGLVRYFSDDYKMLQKVLAKYSPSKKYLVKIKVITFSFGTTAIKPFATWALKRIIRQIRIGKIVPKKDRWTVVVYRYNPAWRKRELHTY